MTPIRRCLAIGVRLTAAAVLAFSVASPAIAQRASPVPRGGPPDAYVGDIAELQQLGREGDVIGCVSDTPLCNAGGTPIPTLGVPNSAHPFFVWNMYRQSPGGTRFEQIGWSWAKHMCCSAQLDVCGFGCTPHDDTTHLGVGCSDTYNASYNSRQFNMGPRSEINPWTAQFEYAGSWIQRTGGAFNSSIDHRLQVRDADLNPAENPGATYFIEQYTVSLMDPDHLNSVAHEHVTVSGAPGGVWTFDTSPVSRNGPAILSWSGAQFTTIPPSSSLTIDGRCLVGYRATPNTNGTWHYEYAVYNHDMNSAVQSFSLPVGSAAITNIESQSPFVHDEVRQDNVPWTSSLAGGRLTFATRPFMPEGTSNPISWGTMHTFRFDADRAPVPSNVTITPYLPGPLPSFTGAALAPAGECRADWDHSGTITSEDFFAFLADVFNENADINRDGVTNSQDLFDFLVQFFAGCA